MSGSAILRDVRGACAICVTLALVGMSVGVHAAVAQGGDGVYVNPNSPSGVEYDIPLERARREADPATPAGAPVARGPQAAASARFGQGITAPTRSAARARRATRQSGAGAHKQRRGRRTHRHSGPLPPAIVSAAARPVTRASTTSSALYGVAGAVLVAAGGLGGWLARRRRRG